MKHREIAEHLEIPEGTSKTLLSNARSRIREMITRKGEWI
jgi:DNA-directed RNA polymerase specialized sigma24 family protein